jgi:hypothetical protein
MTYDVARGRVILFAKNASFNETWEWDGEAWTDISPSAGAPGTREGHVLVYDARRERSVLFGGNNGPSFNDTWTFRYTEPGTLQKPARSDESCQYGFDTDGDGALGCADPDCFGACSPLCNPTLGSCAADIPRCGDGTCSAVETTRLCPADCGALVPICGDSLCELPETAVTCVGDCS